MDGDACRLCKKNKPLMESHIIPKFVGAWLKKTSATGFMRGMDNPNKRLQDLTKVKLLCKECEDIFSNYESYFANNIFYPYINRKNNGYVIPYDSKLCGFCVSLSWRVLVYYTEILNVFDKEQVDKAKNVFSEYLLGNLNSIGKFEQHLIPLQSNSFDGFVDNTNLLVGYITRGVHADFFDSQEGGFFYVKIPNFLLISNVDLSCISKMRGSRVALGSNIFLQKRYFMPSSFFSHISFRLKFFKENITDKISDKQNKVMLDTVKKDIQRASNSLTMKSVEASLFPYMRVLRKNDPF